MKQNPSPTHPLLPHGPQPHLRTHARTLSCVGTHPFTLYQTPTVQSQAPFPEKPTFVTMLDRALSYTPKIGGRSCRKSCGKRRARRLLSAKRPCWPNGFESGAPWLLRRVSTVVAIPDLLKFVRAQIINWFPINWHRVFCEDFLPLEECVSSINEMCMGITWSSY